MTMRQIIDRRGVLGALAMAPLAGACARSNNDRTVRVLHIETNADVLRIWHEAARRFAARRPGVQVDFRLMEPRAFQSRRATMLQSEGRPHLFYSWGGASLDAFRAAGLLDDITDHVDPAHVATLMPQATAAYRREGRLYGLPYLAAEIGVIANRSVLAAAGLSIGQLGAWDGFQRQLTDLKRRGIAPLAVGGMDGWQLLAVLSGLTIRTGGRQGIADALKDENGGFESHAMLRAAGIFGRFAATSPFQAGYLSSKAQTAMQFFVGGGAGYTMHGSWFYRQAAALTGRSPDDIAAAFPFVGFPSLDGKGGSDGITQGQLNGWLVSRGAPRAAVDFLVELTGHETQAALAAGGHIIPANLPARSSLTQPELRAGARRLDATPSIQLSWDQLLGSNGGPTAIDTATRLASGAVTPETAMATIRRGWVIERHADRLDGVNARAIDDLVGGAAA